MTFILVSSLKFSEQHGDFLENGPTLEINGNKVYDMPFDDILCSKMIMENFRNNILL